MGSGLSLTHQGSVQCAALIAPYGLQISPDCSVGGRPLLVARHLVVRAWFFVTGKAALQDAFKLLAVRLLGKARMGVYAQGSGKRAHAGGLDKVAAIDVKRRIGNFRRGDVGGGDGSS